MVTLHRPDRLNAFTSRMMTDLIVVLDEDDREGEVWSITGAGAGREFCAGADVGGAAPSTTAPRASVTGTSRQDRPVPVRLRQAGDRGGQRPRGGGGGQKTLPMDIRRPRPQPGSASSWPLRRAAPHGGAPARLADQPDRRRPGLDRGCRVVLGRRRVGRDVQELSHPLSGRPAGVESSARGEHQIEWIT
ncbi:enoyl-CoA hydratase/isomerase family protein [Streptomyces gilvus]|uniref:enoyl-CoA hydratase/isomerase family protein n=1 Tax=Streptomyces gilvus TaxID=2920937 RepID=UPI0035A91950